MSGNTIQRLYLASVVCDHSLRTKTALLRNHYSHNTSDLAGLVYITDKFTKFWNGVIVLTLGNPHRAVIASLSRVPKP